MISYLAQHIMECTVHQTAPFIPPSGFFSPFPLYQTSEQSDNYMPHGLEQSPTTTKICT